MDKRVINGLADTPPELRGCVLTIGNFDGVHLGHRRILEAAGKLARSKRMLVAAMTFEPPPDLVLRPDDPPQRLTPLAQKTELLLAVGADRVVVAHADMDLLTMEPTAFIDRVIVANFSPRFVVEGPNFFFGRRREGTTDMLAEAGYGSGFEVRVEEPLELDLPGGAERVCSTLVRRLIGAGEVDQAAACLGRPYTLWGAVVRGKGRGRVLDFPTANLARGEQIVPADGIYAGWAQIDDERFAAAISIGSKPTFGVSDEAVVEAYLLDAGRRNFYNKSMALQVAHRLRDQRRFDSADALRDQIAKDVQRVREFCKKDV